MSQNYHQLNGATYRPIPDRSIREVGLDEARALIANHLPVLDVREPVEVEQGMLEGTVHIPLGEVAERVERALPDKSIPVVIYCAAGVRSFAAAEIMAELGYADPISMAPGFNGWKAAGL